MDPDIAKILIENQEKGDGFYTHTSQIRPTGRFNFTRKTIEDFWELYCRKLHEEPDLIAGVAERPIDYLPILADIDIKIPFNGQPLDKKLYTNNHTKQTILIYQKHLKQAIKDYKSHYGITFLLEKKFPTFDKDKNEIGHGFHLHFPFTVMHRVDQDVHIIPRVRKEVEDKQLFNDIGDNLKYDKIIDKSCTNKQWLIYGSRKKENLQRYVVTKIFDDQCNEISLEEAMQHFTLKNVHGDEIELTEELEYYLPRILSIHPEHKDPVQVKHDLSIISKAYLKKAKESKKVYEDLPVPEALKKAKDLMKLVSSSRADNYEDWMDIGWVLYNIGDGCEEALDMWTEFSSRTTKKNNFSEKVCIYEWERMEKRGRTIGSLYHYAKIDDKEGYKKYCEKEEKNNINNSLNGGHYDLAKILHNKYRDEFICASPDEKTIIWYRYYEHRWHLETKGIALKKKISTYLTEIYESKKRKILQDMADEGDENPEFQKKIKIVNKLLSNLKSSPFKKNIMTEAEELFHDENFIKKLNANPYLMHFKNGILDLKEMIFREGRPNDYITLSTGYEYKADYDWDHIDILETDDFLNKIFPDSQLKQYFLEYAANLLKGGNNIKTFLVMSGSGDNGKSVAMDFLELVLGQYMQILPTSLITGKRTQSSGHTAELDDLEGVRFVIVQEPSTKDSLNIGILKELSGNDKIYKRGMYAKKSAFRPLFKFGMICNRLPRLPCDDPAAWNRIRVLMYESFFPKDHSIVPKTVDEQFKQKIFPRDGTFSEKLPKLKSAFMWILWQTYIRITKEGRMPEPEKVRDATSLYRRNNDVFLQFSEEKIIEDPEDDKIMLSVTEVYNSFKTWFHDSYPNMKVPDKEDMKEDLLVRWGKLSRTQKWKGYRLRTAEDDERDGRAIILREEDLENGDSNDKSEGVKIRNNEGEEEDVQIIEEEDISDDEDADSDASEESSDSDEE